MTPGLRSGGMMGSREQLRIGGAIAAGLVLATCVVLIALQVVSPFSLASAVLRVSVAQCTAKVRERTDTHPDRMRAREMGA